MRFLEYYDVYNLNESFIEDIDKYYREEDDILVEYDPTYEHAFCGEYAKYNKLDIDDFKHLNNVYADNWIDDVDYSEIDLNCNREENIIKNLRIDINKVVKTFRYFNWREPYSDDELLNYVENGQFDDDYSLFVDIMKRETINPDKEKCVMPQVMLRSVFDDKVFDTWGDRISRIGEYKSAMDYMVFKCNECGVIYSEIGRSVYNGKGCPECNKRVSNGEFTVEQILKELNIEFDKQCSDGCRNPKTDKELPFDFVINNYGSTIYVEVQGRQHYAPVEYFGGKDGYESTMYRDSIKRQYAESNGTFVELDYREHDINLLKLRVKNQLLPLLKEVI